MLCQWEEYSSIEESNWNVIFALYLFVLFCTMLLNEILLESNIKNIRLLNEWKWLK